VTDPRSLARWRCSGRTGGAATGTDAEPVAATPAPGLSPLELRALAAIRAAGGELDAHGLRAAGVAATTMQAGALLLDLQNAGLVERTRHGWRIAEGSR
jgi:hypothetical protein